ncbi:MAG: PP2C family protein-serine/threonine phosphatase [Armatimonadetes bacterium]|nr:PP2C family protein-serine/threonine phosphatase [Armatimonadota bacterium]
MRTHLRTDSANIGTVRPLHKLMVAIRWTMFVFVFVSAWQVEFTWARVQAEPVMISVAVIAAASLSLQWASTRWQWLRQPILVLLGDVLMVSTVVYFSDGIMSPYYPLYSIVVIIAAVDFGLFGALVCAAALTAISLPIDTFASTTHPMFGELTTDGVRTNPYLFFTALIAGALRERIRALDSASAAMLAERAAREREMEVAATIQRAQLPPQTPAIEGLQIAVTYMPAREVGGDLYDFFPVHPTRPGVMIADVSGKGVPAALLVSSCKFAVRENMSDDLAAMARSANQSLLPVTTDEMFVTMLYGRFDLAKREFTYVNAGHMPPIIVKPDGTTLLPEYSDPPLAALLQPDYMQRTITLEAGDTLVLYTDGVTDALADNDGIEELRDLLGSMADTDINLWGDEFIRKTGQPRHVDDVTIVALKVQ